MCTISVTTTQKSRQIRKEIFRDSTNTLLLLKQYYIVNDTNTVCYENIYYVETNKIKHAHVHDFPSKWHPPLNLIIFFATQV